LVSAEPSLFSVGGSQSRVATPFVVVVLTGVVLLLLEATVVVVVVPEVVPEVVLVVVPEAGVVVFGAAALEAVPDEEVAPDATVATVAAVAAVATVATVATVAAVVTVDAAPVFATVAVVAVVSIPCERSIMPTFGDTRLAAESEVVEPEVVDAAAALLDPSSPPQAARVSVASVHRTTLRI
jgi:hypothetical protein